MCSLSELGTSCLASDLLLSLALPSNFVNEEDIKLRLECVLLAEGADDGTDAGYVGGGDEGTGGEAEPVVEELLFHP